MPASVGTVAALFGPNVRVVVVEVEEFWDRARDPDCSTSFRCGDFLKRAVWSIRVCPLNHVGCKGRPEVVEVQVAVDNPSQLEENKEEHEESFVLMRDVRISRSRRD